MPEMNGLELVEAVRARYPRIPVVLVTAQGSEAIAVQALEHGAASYVPKSQLHHDLCDTLESVLAAAGDRRTQQSLMQRMRSMRRRCGQLWVELASAKFQRVQQTHAEIERTAAPQIPDAAFLLSSAESMLKQAREQLQQEQFAEAERLSRYVMQLLRQLQRTHWENAVAGLGSEAVYTAYRATSRARSG